MGKRRKKAGFFGVLLAHIMNDKSFNFRVDSVLIMSYPIHSRHVHISPYPNMVQYSFHIGVDSSSVNVTSIICSDVAGKPNCVV